MYLTLCLWLNVLDSMDSMCISSLCLSSLLSMALYAREPRSNPKSYIFTSRSVTRPRQSIVIFDAWRRTLGKRCNCTSRSCVWPHESVGRATQMLKKICNTPIPGKHCASPPKCATLSCVLAFDHANPWEGLRVSAKVLFIIYYHLCS